MSAQAIFCGLLALVFLWFTWACNLDDIYAKAAQAFEVDIRTIAWCTYQELPEVMPEGGPQ